MSKENYFIKAYKKIREDIKNNWVAFIAIAAYFLCAHFFLHSICPMVIFTGFPCPACGLTRAGVALLTGQFGVAWTLHPFIYVFVILAVLFVLNRYFLEGSIKWLKVATIICLVALIAFYIYRMIRYFPGAPPMSYYNGSMIHILVERIM